MKKFRSIVALFLVTLSVAGCGSTQNGADVVPEDLTATISVQAETTWMPYYEAAVARVKEKYPNATINLIETGSFDNLDVLDSTDVTNPDIADVFAIPVDRVYGLAQNEALAEIDAETMASALKGFGTYDEGLGGSFKIDGKYLAFPLNIETLVVFANSANATAKGIDLSKEMEFTKLNPEDMLSVVHDAWFGVAFTNAVDLTLLDKDAEGKLYTDLTKPYSELTKEQQDLFQALFNYWQAHDQLGTDLWDKEAAWGYIDSAFTSGNQTSLRIDGPWATPGLAEKTNGGADMKVLPINAVKVAGNPLTHWQGGWGLAVNARLEGNTEEMALAQEVIKEIVNPEYAVDFFKTTGKILANVKADVYKNSDLPDTDKAVIECTLESYEKAVARPLFTEWGQVWPTWQNALLSWSSVKPATVEAAYEQVQAAFEAMMVNFQ
ncbi:MAG: sugar ABC transporter substrate-binding protein [Cellulosilyticaceae bacterium]